jgi:hypothetical protein
MARIKIYSKFKTDKKHEVYFNKIKTLSRNTEAQSYSNEQHNKQHCIVPRTAGEIAVEREADLPATPFHAGSSKTVT